MSRLYSVDSPANLKELTCSKCGNFKLSFYIVQADRTFFEIKYHLSFSQGFIPKLFELWKRFDRNL